MIRGSIVLLFLFSSLGAQQSEQAKEPSYKVFEPKYLTGDRANRAAIAINEIIKPHGNAWYEGTLKAILVKGNPESVAIAQNLLKQFDVPEADSQARQIQFTIYLVEGSPDPARAAALPKEIASAIEQMRGVFNYKSYRLIDTILLNARGSGDAVSLSGLLPLESQSTFRTTYAMGYRNLNVLEDQNAVAINEFYFSLKIPVTSGSSTQITDAGIRTNLTVKEGQKLVIGKISSDQHQNSMFLVITVDIS
jgi:hypothetical protein